MSEPDEEILCENCVAACCKAPIFMQLTQKEYDRHHGTMALEVIRNPMKYPQRVQLPDIKLDERIPSGHGLYYLTKGCDNLDESNRCKVYDDRPGCCRNYELRSPACLQARRKAGLDADRPMPEPSSAAPLSYDPAKLMISQFFPDTGTKPQSTAAAGNTVAPVGLFDLRQYSRLVDGDARWITERLRATDAWSRRTRCAGWSVGDLAAHLVTALRLADAVLRAAGEGSVVNSPPDFTGDRVTTLRELDTAADIVRMDLESITPGTAAREVVVDDGSVTALYLVEVLVMEFAVHSLDLADALGEARELAPEAVGPITRVLPDLLDPGAVPPRGIAYLLRSPAFEMPFVWDGTNWSHRAAPNACVIEGDSESVLLYALGRIPFDKAQLTTNRLNVARSFKRYLTGP